VLAAPAALAALLVPAARVRPAALPVVPVVPVELVPVALVALVAPAAAAVLVALVATAVPAASPDRDKQGTGPLLREGAGFVVRSLPRGSQQFGGRRQGKSRKPHGPACDANARGNAVRRS
jgi:hypothetical protein